MKRSVVVKLQSIPKWRFGASLISTAIPALTVPDTNIDSVPKYPVQILAAPMLHLGTCKVWRMAATLTATLLAFRAGFVYVVLLRMFVF